nr:MAG TPA: hypothetical protein [Caudoviricetes sp.]
MVDFEELFPCFEGSNSSMRLMLNRMGNLKIPKYNESTVQGVTDMSK